MRFFKRLFRLMHISYILFKHGLDEIVLATHLFRPIRYLAWLSPSCWNGRHHLPRGKRIREALEELGPIYVKFGQLLSTRYDILPEDIIQELIRLQDQVPPFRPELAIKMIENALGSPLTQLFQEFDATPIASASIAQVHSAILLDGQAVVVKVLRPHIHQFIKKDVALLKTLANMAQRYSKIARRFKPREIVAEFERALLDELDLIREASNASQLRRNFVNSPLLYIPEIHWPLTTHSVLVMERIHGIPISNIALLKEPGVDLKKLAERAIEIFFTQVFRDCFFHADMHPGNIFVSTIDPTNPSFIVVDFGIMGILSNKDQLYLAENLMAFLKRDYRRVAELHMESGWVPSHIRIDEFEASIRAVSEPMFERPLKDISFGQLLFRLFQTAARFHINIQPQLILLQKTLMNIESLSRQLDPDIDLWHTAKPHLERWMKNQVGIPALIRKLKNAGPFWIEKLPDLPDLIYKALTQLADTSSPYAGATMASTVHTTTLIKPTSKTSLKDICIGLLLGLSLSLLWIVTRGYF